MLSDPGRGVYNTDTRARSTDENIEFGAQTIGKRTSISSKTWYPSRLKPVISSRESFTPGRTVVLGLNVFQLVRLSAVRYRHRDTRCRQSCKSCKPYASAAMPAATVVSPLCPLLPSQVLREGLAIKKWLRTRQYAIDVGGAATACFALHGGLTLPS